MKNLTNIIIKTLIGVNIVIFIVLAMINEIHNIAGALITLAILIGVFVVNCLIINQLYEHLEKSTR